MKIKAILEQHKKFFTATYSCHCGHAVELDGYDDADFHAKVIPNMKCPKCGEDASAATEEYRPLTTKYKASDVV